MENTSLNRSQDTSGPTLQFEFELLKHITNNFSKDRIIGSGAYGVVYKVSLLFAILLLGRFLKIQLLITRA
jgi:hypothetical protein